MDIDAKVALIRQVGEEIISEDELRALLHDKKKPVAYDGMEPSGRPHIAQGILRAINVNKMLKAGCRFKLLAADWHAWANNKLGGDLERIQTTGKYLIEVWKACGMDTDKVEFVNCSEFVEDQDYWKLVMQVARNSTLKRILRCSQIMGRSESEELSAAQIFYPAMQAADIFQLDVDICQLGMDQRKVNMLARELAPKLGKDKPVAVHHHMLMGLEQPQPLADGADARERAIAMKMSKSRPDSAIFMDDTAQEVERKMGKAWCPARQLHENPVMEYCKFMVFEKFKSFDVKRPAKFGGDRSFKTYEELAAAYEKGEIHPMDLKSTTARYINESLEPVRKHFSKGKAHALMETVRGYQVTR